MYNVLYTVYSVYTVYSTLVITFLHGIYCESLLPGNLYSFCVFLLQDKDAKETDWLHVWELDIKGKS